MTAPNRNTLWARIVVDELAKGGVDRIVIAPGSRSTPLTVAADRNERVRTHTHLDERSAGFFALGQGKRRGIPSALISTSGTAAANFHPAVIEADRARTPLVVLTADRPPELWDSGANQTIDQTDLFGSATRSARTLPVPDPTPRTLRSLRTTVNRALGESTGTYPGPVHLNVPFSKPLAPLEVEDDIPQGLATMDPAAVDGRESSFVTVRAGTVHPDPETVAEIRSAIERADRGLIVAGPADGTRDAVSGIRTIARATGFPVLADPLSGVRFGDHVSELTVLGGYDGYLGSTPVQEWPDPEVVLRVGASPTSKVLREYLRDGGARQFLVDPAGGWREATFAATDLVESDIRPLADRIAETVVREPNRGWHERFERAEANHWAVVSGIESDDWEGGVLRAVVEVLPDPSTLFVSNSMPVRDLDRFGAPRAREITALGNRGASGIDGITSTALGAGSVAAEPLVLVTGDLAFFHDMNGLLALDRFGLEATVVLINNDGGGIFHMLPIEDFDPPFESQFRTPHGLDFEPTSALYDLEFSVVRTSSGYRTAITEAVHREGTQVIEVRTDAERSHRVREEIASTVADRIDR